MTWERAFALTVLIELSVAVPLLGRARSLGRRLAVVSVAQLATHPIVWFVVPRLGLGRSQYLLLAETGAVVTELLIFRLVLTDLSWSRALAVSALANAASLLVGTLLG